MQHNLVRSAIWLILALAPAALAAQDRDTPDLGSWRGIGATDAGGVDSANAAIPRPDPARAMLPHALSPRDSMAAVTARESAWLDHALHVEVDIEEKTLRVVRGDDTLRTADIAVGMDSTLAFDHRTWIFQTPRGVRRVISKEPNPSWSPPDWHYAEVAHEYGFKLARLTMDKPVRLSDGSRLVVRHGVAGVVVADSGYQELPLDEEIVFDSTLYIPPVGSKNRRIMGELGRYRLDLGGGYLIHGTPQEESIGTASTHGCIRLRDEDITWLYEHIPVGTKVYLY